MTKLSCFVTGLSCHGGAYLPGSHQIKQNVPFTVAWVSSEYESVGFMLYIKAVFPWYEVIPRNNSFSDENK